MCVFNAFNEYDWTTGRHKGVVEKILHIHRDAEITDRKMGQKKQDS